MEEFSRGILLNFLSFTTERFTECREGGVQGVDPNARSVLHSPKMASPADHRAPKYGQQWRHNVILRGKWSPAPELGVSDLTRPTDTNHLQSVL